MTEKKLKVFKYTDGKITKYVLDKNENIQECKEPGIGVFLDLGEGNVHGGSRLITEKVQYLNNSKEMTAHIEGGINDYFSNKYGIEI